MDRRLNMIGLGVRNLAASIAFYERLGWAKSEKYSTDSLAVIVLDSIVLTLYDRDALADDALLKRRNPQCDKRLYEDRNGTPRVFGGITFAQNMPSRDDVDHVLKTAGEAGATLMKPAQDVFWGGYSGYFADPDGHLFEIAHNPFWPLDADGRLALD